MKKNHSLFALIILLSLFSCTLEKEDYDMLPDNVFFKTEKDCEAALVSVYEPLAGRSGGLFHGMLMASMTTFPELATDVLDCYWNWDRFDKHQYNNSNMIEGGESLNPFAQYKFVTADQAFIERVKKAPINDHTKKRMIAEAKTIKAYMMFRLYTIFGAVPIVPNDKVLLTTDLTFYPRLSDAQYISLIEQLIEEALPDLPEPKICADNTRMNKGIANMILMKTYMVGNAEKWNQMGMVNGKQMDNMVRWEKVKNYAQAIIDLKNYTLQKSYTDVFSINNQRNKEIIYAVSLKVGINGNEFHMHVMPAQHPWTKSYNVQTSEGYALPWDFVDTFDKSDMRLKKNIITHFSPDDVNGDVFNRENTDVKTFKKGAVPFKYDMDPGHIGETSNHDYVVFRYADVVLAMAEALNELNGNPAESYAWIDMIRVRAGLTKLPQQFTQSRFRNEILTERGHELFLEGHRFVDLVRHNKFIEYAAATPGSDIRSNDMNRYGYKCLFPIPIEYISEYKGVLVQNAGY